MPDNELGDDRNETTKPDQQDSNPILSQRSLLNVLISSHRWVIQISLTFHIAKLTIMADQSFPSSLIIIGAGIFGLSTALAVARRYPSTNIIVVDRLTPPVLDGTSVDTTRCIRAGMLVNSLLH